MPDCVFCRIVAGSIPAVKVDENGEAFAFLDIQPLREGHTIVIPKRHATRLSDLDDPARRGLWELVHGLVPRVERAVSADGMTVAVNDGRAAGQEVPHVHVHLVPRSTGDGHGPIHALFGGGKKAEPARLQALAGHI